MEENNILVVEMTESEADRLEKDKNILLVEEDIIFEASDVESEDIIEVDLMNNVEDDLDTEESVTKDFLKNLRKEQESLSIEEQWNIDVINANELSELKKRQSKKEENNMKLTIDKSQLNRKSKADCRIKSFIIALALEGLYYTPSEILLDANALDFDFVDINPEGTAMHTLLGVSSDLFEKFSENTGINILHYSDKNDAEDLEIICNAISNGHCVIAMTDRYGLFRLLNPKIFRNISANKHMTQHMIVIYGVDLEKKQFLICEASSSIKKFHSVWIDIDKLNTVRECKFLGLGIKKDIYIIENTSGYIKPNFNEMLFGQINKWKNALSDSIPRLREFVSFFENSDKMNHTLERYLMLQSQVLAVTVGGFDKSQYFYRGDFLEMFSSIYAGEKKDEFIFQLSNIKNKWKNIVEQLINLSKGLNSEDTIKVWKLIILVAENEFSFCENFISEYNKINLKEEVTKMEELKEVQLTEVELDELEELIVPGNGGGLCINC